LRPCWSRIFHLDDLPKKDLLVTAPFKRLGCFDVGFRVEGSKRSRREEKIEKRREEKRREEKIEKRREEKRREEGEEKIEKRREEKRRSRRTDDVCELLLIPQQRESSGGNQSIDLRHLKISVMKKRSK